MSLVSRARRALLFCPGSERRKITKASGLSADGVIIDLEDAVAQDCKEEARETTAKALRELSFGRSERLVRINPINSGLAADDLEAVSAPDCLPDAIVIPKVQSAADLTFVVDRVRAFAVRAGRTPESVRLLAIIESARGLVNLREIAAATPALDALIFGAEDYCGDTGAVRTSGGVEVLYARSAVIAHAAAFGLQAIDTPYVQFNDLEGCEVAAQSALHLGFSGMLAIHPRQIAPINAVFTPSPEAVDAAERLIAAHNAHQSAGRGVFELDGQMVDMPMVRAALRILARAVTAD